MGGCFSVHGDVRGGMEGVGGGARTQGGAASSSAQQGGPNDAVDYFFQTRGLRGLYTPIELSFSASKLRNTDSFSKSDPMLVVYTNIKGKLEEIGRTEVILNSLEPSWITKVTMSYQFEIVQPLMIYDVDTKYHNTPVKIVTKFNRSLTLNLQSDCGHGLHGTMTVHAEESDSSRMAVEMTLRCVNLENKDVFSKSDPFLRISKLVETAGPIPICKTEVVPDNLNPVWRPITLTSQQYGSKASKFYRYDGTSDNPLLVECFDFNSSGDHELIGAFQTTITQLENLYTSKSAAIFYNHKGQRKMKEQLFVDKFQETVQHTFLDYISSGFELNFMVAIDFTASNGDPRVPQSLHYIDPSGRPNSYQQFYDNDRRFPTWGFGARVHGYVSHCFNLNTATNDSEVVGVEGIMSAYTSSLYSVSLAGPTMFGPVINKAADIASQSLQYSNNKYFVLLIITDGVLTDIQETKDCIVRASDLPLSILIVGVGNADFKQMEILDADNGKRLESSTGRIATRDIVQFVPMREVQGGEISVVQSLLEELPGQFLQYMRTRGIKPQRAPGLASAPVYPPQQ
ncbi:Protein BONZAI 3 [Zea mays]|uniref:Protein BONZAI 3 n=1 Tax=Zea mays TaxID=4577 RepID=A0A1D6M1F1_MAIZE|nr:Protein BONZAI 3 [Zea mays]